MKTKNALFIALCISICYVPSYCMEQKNFNDKQIHILTARMRENPAAFNSLAQPIAHELYQRNPTITRSDLMNFFRTHGLDHPAVLPLEFIKQIWQFIVCERFGDTWAEDIRRFVTISCYAKPGGENLTNPSKPFVAYHLHTAPNTFIHNWIYALLGGGEQLILTEEAISPLTHYSTPDQITQMITIQSADAAKQLHLFYGKNRAVLIINDRTNIFVIPNITYITRYADTLTTDNNITTGLQLLENIDQASSHCQQFTNWNRVRKLLAQLDLTKY